ncbi:MAG: hypothetical protein O9267_11380 [Flavobacterium sp.]|uniref:hypothetical protein n=1 Tax=Flavobacterium sp. TaxID=239 RepID=UPI0022C87E5A|nr:hypothetical protein [Flavobacterium sp.]MCZ8198197.1 hypothetical protein [Flavobacterium sp.]
MHKATFTIKKSKLKSELSKMQNAYKGISKKAPAAALELTITDELLTLVVPGIKLEVPCKTSSTAKVSIGFYYFYEIIKSWKDLQIEFTIIDDEMQIGVSKFKVQTTFFEDDKILRSIKLPINYTDYHLLQLEDKGFTLEELRFNDLEFEVHQAKKRLRSNVNKTKDILGVYGVTSKEIEEILEKKIKL